MKTSRTYVSASLTVLGVAVVAVSLLQAEPKQTDTVTDCSTYFNRCIANCDNLPHADCRHLCYVNLDKCVTNATAHASRPRATLPPVPSGGVAVDPTATPIRKPIPRPSTAGKAQKSAATATPSATASPKATAKPKTKDKQ